MIRNRALFLKAGFTLMYDSFLMDVNISLTETTRINLDYIISYYDNKASTHKDWYCIWRITVTP